MDKKELLYIYLHYLELEIRTQDVLIEIDTLSSCHVIKGAYKI